MQPSTATALASHSVNNVVVWELQRSSKSYWRLRAETFIRHLENEIFLPCGLGSARVLPWYTVEVAHQKESHALQHTAGYFSPLWRRSALEPGLCPAWGMRHSVHFPFKFTRKINDYDRNDDAKSLKIYMNILRYNLRQQHHNVLKKVRYFFIFLMK